ncbi:MAG: DUF2309 domain-containing protein [Alphaproteobacteria bacterium]|nr:MAG: DUF2309 domain-containing protein [Alphaproteobacteria bacterium]
MEILMLKKMIQSSWNKMAPFWPLQNLIAVNPLQGLEHLPIHESLKEAMATFEQEQWPPELDALNAATIKWCQTYYDKDQATLKLPGRQRGFYQSLCQLLPHDCYVHQNDPSLKKWLQKLPSNALQAIELCLLRLEIPEDDQEQFLFLMLVTLPGWAAHVKYRAEWAPTPREREAIDYLAARLIITVCMWPEAAKILPFYQQQVTQLPDVKDRLSSIEKTEKMYVDDLSAKLEKSASKMTATNSAPDAQLVFCIDVRSEQIRRAIEKQGNYQTIGFAGFFGLPISIRNGLSKEEHASCPVLLKPTACVEKTPKRLKKTRQFYRTTHAVKRLYQALKYSFLTPLALVEATGSLFGFWAMMRSLFPRWTSQIQKKLSKELGKINLNRFDLSAIPLEDQVKLASGALQLMGLTKNYATQVVFCGHGSTTQNNAFASSLDCGACGGHEGLDNARVLAQILNQQAVRKGLQERGLIIPDQTVFYGARHDTTTDQIDIYTSDISEKGRQLQLSLGKARQENIKNRLKKLPVTQSTIDAAKTLSSDWAQVRPEWGLARNASLIVGPRSWTQEINLEGRSFLHEYEWQTDTDSTHLTTIMTAPMVVAHWINMQYFFSTLNPVAYGAGSKITQNITGKIGVMQGNASDLMHGLALQSVYENDTTPYHQPLRLQVFIYAPLERVQEIVNAQPKIAALIKNKWIFINCFDPDQKAMIAV